MPELIAIAYQTPEVALAARNDVLRLGPAYLDDVGDAVLASVDGNGVIVLDQVVNLWSLAPKGNMLRGLIAELLFLCPLQGLMETAISDTVSRALNAFGLLEAPLARVRQQLRPGHAMMFVWLAGPVPAALRTALEPGEMVLHESIDAAKLPLVQSAFARAHQHAREQRETAYGGNYVGT